MKKEFYVCFERADHYDSFYFFLDPEYSHTYAYEHLYLDGYDIFMKSENVFNGIDSCLFFGTPDEFEEAIKDTHYVKITVDIDYEKHYYDVFPLNCVVLTKKQLGINKPGIFTPKQLYRLLMNMGGEEHK